MIQVEDYQLMLITVSAEATTMVDTAFDKTTSNSWEDFGI